MNAGFVRIWAISHTLSELYRDHFRRVLSHAANETIEE